MALKNKSIVTAAKTKTRDVFSKKNKNIKRQRIKRERIEIEIER
jgi:hypothetical protein